MRRTQPPCARATGLRGSWPSALVLSTEERDRELSPPSEAFVIGSATLQPLAQRARQEASVVEVAREAILRVLSAGHPPIETVAETVSTSVRTLQRRLAASGRTLAVDSWTVIA